MLEQLLQQRLAEFKPEPLVEYDPALENEIIEIPMIKEDENVIDLAKVNFLNVLNNEEIKQISEDVIRKYGVGTCGPRAFYGTTDIHLEVEKCIAEFLKVEEAIVYSYGAAAISSSIAAYCKKSDYVFVDEEANFNIFQGLKAAKSKVVKFSHCDPKDFRSKVKKVEKSRGRKFLVIEAISWNTGKICPLIDFLEVAEEFKIRVFLEESYSLGVLGKHGRGITEHFDVDISRVDMLFGTLEGAVGSIGGFCAGSHFAIEHQRLSGLGYVFSASQPTYLAKVAIKSIELFDDKPQKLLKLANDFHNFLSNECQFDVISDPISPFKVFTVSDQDKTKELNVFNYCKANGLFFIRKENGLVINLNVELYDNSLRLAKIYEILASASLL